MFSPRNMVLLPCGSEAHPDAISSPEGATEEEYQKDLEYLKAKARQHITSYYIISHRIISYRIILRMLCSGPHSV